MSEQRVLVELDVPVPMRDGVTLRANVYRPPEGRWPVLLTRLPYGKDLPLGSASLDPIQAVRRGYVVIVQDTRGRFASEGEWRPFELEADDGFDTVEWAARRPYADGQVGMFGVSYFGFTQWAAAIKQPPALKAIAPRITWSDALNGFAFRGGAMELGTPANWGLQMGFDQFAKQHRGNLPAIGAAFVGLTREMDALASDGYASLPLNEFGPLRRHPVLARFFEQVERPLDPEMLDPVTIKGKHDRVQVPSLNVGGWYDIFLADTITNFQSMRALGRPAKLLIGPWTHLDARMPVGELNFGFASQAGFINLQYDMDRLQLRWFDHWLKSVDTGMLAEPPIKIFVMGTNVWRDEQEWPLARAVPTPYYLHAGGALRVDPPSASVAPDRFVYDPADPVPTHGGALLMAPEYLTGPRDQRAIEARPDVLTYTTDVLERDMEVTGPVTVSLWACSSAPDTDFVARLVDVYPDGRAYNLTDGILRARYRRGFSNEVFLEPGVPERFDIDLWATSNVFRAGHRVRLQVTSSNFPRWDRNPNTGHRFGTDSLADLRTAEQTILHDADHPSHVLLPVVPTN
ncbi:MAG: CocE/NonD family hydrolase [Chloroflexi bacterium]|nr:CocE/NonD family hydrolase [Chloroflexota bacterium]